MSFCLLFYHSVFVSPTWCQAYWPLQYYLYTQLYHKMALHVAAIAKLTLNVLDNGDTAPCHFLLSSCAKPRLLLSSLEGWYTIHVSPYLKAFVLDEQTFARLVILYVPA